MAQQAEITVDAVPEQHSQPSLVKGLVACQFELACLVPVLVSEHFAPPPRRFFFFFCNPFPLSMEMSFPFFLGNNPSPKFFSAEGVMES